MDIDEKRIHSGNKCGSQFCIICKKIEPENKLLLCQACNFNLVHVACAKIELN